jgi:type II secretory pathway component PulK
MSGAKFVGWARAEGSDGWANGGDNGGAESQAVDGRFRRRSRARGAALVIALLLLVVLTLLAISGMRMSIAELWMAGHEQFHRRASDAASAGIEASIARIQAGGAAGAVQTGGAFAFGEPPTDSYTVSIRQTGRETSLPGSSVGKFSGEHFEIESVGTSSRGARDVQVQGVMVVSSANGVTTFGGVGAGLAGEGGAP